MDGYPPDLKASFKSLSDSLAPEEKVDTTLGRIANLSVQIVHGCDFSGVSLVENGSIRTVGHTSPLVKEIDEIQYATHQGPCLSAIGDEGGPDGPRTFEIVSMAEDRTWPEFSSRAADKGLNSLLAFTLRTPQKVLGSLNLYATRPEAFDFADRTIGAIFAAHASVALANAQAMERAQRRVDELLDGYAHREVIGQAKGILMEREGCTEEQAFAILARVSQRLEKRLRDVAMDVIESRSSEDPPST